MSTQFPSAKSVQRVWHVIDAKDQVLGRIATKAATLLMGKHKPTYTPFLEQKMYYRHSGYPGGLVETSARAMRAKHPDRIVRLAVAGMLPKTTLGKQMIRKLKVYAADKHPHEAQKPVVLGA